MKTNKTNSEDEANQRWKFGETSPGSSPASGSADAPDGIDMLIEAVKAGWRLKYYGYHHWAVAGGVDECKHGIAAGIFCERCDEIRLMEAYTHLQSPNKEVSEPARET